jgi:uncharacterized protein
MDIIDFHAHPELDDHSLQSVMKMMQLAKGYGIVRICLLGDVLHFGYEPSEEQIRKINSQTIEIVKRWPGFFYGFCYLNPQHPVKFLQEETERCLACKNFKGIKLEAAVNAADRRVDKVMRIARKFELIVLQHSWNTEVINNRKHQSDPEDVACLARRFPDVKIVMAHITAATERGVIAIQSCKNVWADTSGAQPVAGTIEYAVEKLGPERIIFGTDVPGRDFSPQLSKIYGSRISEHARRLILYENAKKLLGAL